MSQTQLSQSEISSKTTSAAWTPPSEFDEFHLERPLGRGAMGVIYLAHDRSLDRQVAVKFIAAPRPHSRLREHFQREARAIARLQHPNVVTVFRIGEIEDRPYIVSEYLVGRSLDTLNLPLPWRRALGLGLGLARGLAAAHRQGVLHRDLKPANVFLTSEGEVKLLDFGLAEFVHTGGPTPPGEACAAVGTPRYMAPELFRGVPATPQSDIYALGLLLYELCTGTLPPQEDGSLPLSTRVSGIDLDFASIIERCLHVDPGERFASAETLCLALERLHEPSVLAAGNPYRGLAPFEAEHRALFFGRDADIRAVIERLRRQPWVLVAGDSGVGKSSLCRAGILPLVTLGALDEHRDFSTLTLEPGRRPLSALAAALAPVLGEPEAVLGARLSEAQGWLGPALRAACQGGRGLLLFIDQLEELITLSEPAQAARFASHLGELTLPAPGVRVLLAVRGDFLTRLGALPGLGDELERALYVLRPLPPSGVREAIVGPARSRGVAFESEALVQRLVAATEQGVGSLPLLQFTLAELWERRDPAKGRITQEALEEMGGVAGALSRYADGVIAQLDHATQQAARRLLGRLITSEGTRNERSEEELTNASAEASTALRVLVKARLLHARSEGGRASYEIAHEALISSWGSLRHWLDEDAGQRALRERVEAAGAKWNRLGRATDLLWGRRQLREVQALATADLGAREQDFLRASQRAARSRSLRRWRSVLFLVLGMGAFSCGLRLKAHRDTQRFVTAATGTAQSVLAKGQALAQSASERRDKALALFNGHGAPSHSALQDPQDLRQLAEATWAQALEELEQADGSFIEAERALEGALTRAPDHPDAHQLFTDLIYERIMLAERFHRLDERARLLKKLQQLAAKDTTRLKLLEAPAEIEIETRPPGAKVELTRYVNDGTKLRREPVPGHSSLGQSPIARVSLPAGSYQLRFTREGYAPVELPLLLERGRLERIQVELLPSVPEGYVYIPPGCSFMGSSDPEVMRKFLVSAPQHRRCLEKGYFIGKTEVTLGNWLAYLDDLPEEAPHRRSLATMHEGIGTALKLWKQPDGTWSFSLRLDNGEILTAHDGEPLRHPGRTHRQEQNWRRFPVTDISAKDVEGYVDWLNRSGKLPGARLCSEFEWMRAARGADSRSYPHGNHLDKGEANIDETYGRKSNAMGPDEVDAHQASTSPFGLLGLAGNAFEMTRPMTLDLGDIVLRGGAWYYGAVGALIANRQAFKSSFHDSKVGVRLCASIPDNH